MNSKAPHIVQYQGSKRKLAPQILQYMPAHFDRLIEPFSGMAAISIASAIEHRSDSFYINDINAPLVCLIQEAVENPERLIHDYSIVWNEQFLFKDEHIQHYYIIRERFNHGEQAPAHLLYLLARCVKGAVRYGKNGNFNQSPDKRRHGTAPKTLQKNVYAISQLLKGKTQFSALDYHEVLDMAQPGDLIYMDPPYQGVTDARDNRYLSGVSFDEFVRALESLTKRRIDYLVSYDGECGGKAYGEELPKSLDCTKITLNAGLSTQAILLGKASTTFESLYVSNSLMQSNSFVPKQISFSEVFA